MTNDTQVRVGYALWAVFACPAGSRPSGADTSSLATAIDALAESDVTLRGIYDVSGLRADADVMLWLHRRRRRAPAGGAALAATFAPLARAAAHAGTPSACTATPSSTRDTCPSFLRGIAPKSWVTVYPFVRSLRLVHPARGRAPRRCWASTAAWAATSRRCQANTVAAFALGDYEWILALEADDLDRPGRPDAAPARHRGAPARARGDPVLHRAADRPRPELDGRCSHRSSTGHAVLAASSAPRIVPADAAHVETPVAYDGILLAGFGGPEGQDDVIPFLRNVTRGRGIPDERLEEVAHHYRHFGGVSPINAQNRALKAAIEAELAARGIDLPVYWGNRNWAPYLEDAVQDAAADGRTTLLAIATSAYSSYSSCRQYREDLARVLDATGLGGDRHDRQGATVLRPPGFRVRLHRGCDARQCVTWSTRACPPAPSGCCSPPTAFRSPTPSAPDPATATSERAVRTRRSTRPSPAS